MEEVDVLRSHNTILEQQLNSVADGPEERKEQLWKEGGTT